MALAMDRGTERAFLRARDILRKEGALKKEDCEELEDLFDEVNGTQFIALMQDPAHRRALREYDRYTRQPALPILIFLTTLLVLSIVMGIYVTLHT